jgi:hypothetical protein
MDYGDPTLGTCKETVEGGNHFRYWTQTGGDADRCGLFALFAVAVFLTLSSGAVFMAVSYELPETCEHTFGVTLQTLR